MPFIRLLPRPSILTGLVVAASTTSGLVFGVVAGSVLVLLSRGRRP